MSVFSRLLDPTVRRFSRLPSHLRTPMATVITTYGAVRFMVHKDVVRRLLEDCGRADIGEAQTSRLDLEASIAILACCTAPTAERAPKLRPLDPVGLPGILGLIFLAEINDRFGVSYPPTLASGVYARNEGESRIQFLMRCGELLQLSDSRWVERMNRSWFPEEWRSFSESLLPGLIIGSARVDDSEIVKRAEADLSNMNEAARLIVSGFMEAATGSGN